MVCRPERDMSNFPDTGLLKSVEMVLDGWDIVMDGWLDRWMTNSLQK
jgi:prophage tail gpP-like protein